MLTVTRGLVARSVVALLLGVIVGTVGTVAHRSVTPWGVTAALALVLCTAAVARAWAGGWTLTGYAVGLFLTVQVLAGKGPGGDVLLPAADRVGWVWVLGAVAVVVLVIVAPRRWFSDGPGRPA